MPFSRYTALRSVTISMARVMAAPIGVSALGSSVGGAKLSAVVKSTTVLTWPPKVTTATSTRLAARLSESSSSLYTDKSGVQLRDRLPGHRAGNVQQQHAGHARLGILGKTVGAKGDLFDHGSIPRKRHPESCDARPQGGKNHGRARAIIAAAKWPPQQWADIRRRWAAKYALKCGPGAHRPRSDRLGFSGLVSWSFPPSQVLVER